MKVENVKVRVEIMVSIGLLSQIDDFKDRWKLPNRSDGVRQLLETALFIENKVGLVETWTSEQIKEIKEQFETAQLVDWIAHLKRDQFNAIYNIVTEENNSRNIKK